MVASLRFKFALDFSVLAIPAILLVALAAASVGYALAMLLKPELAPQLGSFIAIVILLYSPINFPADRLPNVLQIIHKVLPVEYMADLVRWSLTSIVDKGIGLVFAVVTAWCAAGLLASWRVAARRI